MDLSAILASPKLSNSIKENQHVVKCKLDQMDKILNNINSYNTTKYDIEELNKAAKEDAKKGFYEEIDGLKLHMNFPQLDQFDNLNFNKISSRINKGLGKQETIFNRESLLLFKKDDFYEGEFSGQKARKILMKNDNKSRMLKTGLKMISVESCLDNVMIIKKILINEEAITSIEDIYSTFLKILINFGINLKLLDKNLIKYKNIRNSDFLQRSLNEEESNVNENNDFNLIQSFNQIVNLIGISVDSSKIMDEQLMVDYISILLILYSDKTWRYNTQFLNSFSQFFAIVLKRINHSRSSIRIIARKIHKFFLNQPTDYLEFLELFPDRTTDQTNVKSVLCKYALKKNGIKIDHSEERIENAFEDLKKLKLNDEELKLVVSLMDHFFGTEELSNDESQQICEYLTDFKSNYSFEQENENSIDFQHYLCGLVRKYDKKPKKESKKRKIKGENTASKSAKINDSLEIQKIWADIELASELNEEIFSNSD